MAKGKRVSNKPGGEPGRRATSGRQRQLLNIRVRKAHNAGPAVSVPEVIRSKRAARIKKPPVISRAISVVKRFFRSK